MGMSEKQKKAFQAVFNVQQEKGLSGKISKSVWITAINNAGVRTPWKLISPFMDQEGRVDFDELYSEAGIEQETQFLDENEDRTELDAPENQEDDPSEMLGDSENEYLRKRKRYKIKDKDRMFFRNPVFVVEGIDSTNESTVVSVCQSITNAWKFRKQALHDHGNVEFEDFELLLETTGYCMIRSLHVKTLRCRVRKMELMA